MSAARTELRAQLRLAGPLAAMQVGHMTLGLVDTAILGRVDEASLAAVGITSSVLNVIAVFGIGLVMGLDTLIPQALGAGERHRAESLYKSGLLLALQVSLPLTVIACLIPGVLWLFGVDPAVREEALPYLLARLPSIAPTVMFIAQRSLLQAVGTTRPLVIAMVVGNGINFVADWLLVFGDDGLVQLGLPPVGIPKLGALGVGFATTIVSICTALIGALAARAALETRSARHERSTHRKNAAAIARLGWPVGLQLVAEVGIFSLVSLLAGRISATAAAAHQIALMLASTTFHAALGIAAATSVRVGRAVGANDVPGTRLAGTMGLLVSATALSISGLIFITFPELLTGLFTNDPVLHAAAPPLLMIAAAFQLSDAIQAVAAGALRGAGDTRATFFANLAGHYLIGVPVAVGLAFGLDLGATGLWWGLSAGLTGVAIVLTIRFYRLTQKPITRS